MAYKRHKGIRIQPDQFSDWMNLLLDQYGQEIFSATVEITKRISDDAAARLHSEGSFKNRRGKYRKGWVAELRKFVGRFNVVATVYNKTEYRLTHLLEKGHAVKRKKGGDVVGEAKAFPHISEVEDWAIKAYEEALEEGLSNIGKGL